MRRRFEDKVWVVTGAASGIGRATALHVASEGGHVVVVDRDAHGAREVADLAGGHAISAPCDVSDRREVEATVTAVLDSFAHVDVLVNNAAIMSFSRVAETEYETWSKVLATNVTSAFLFSKLCLPHMGPGSSIVNVSSVHAQRSTALVAPYAASKAALEALTRTLSLECASDGIRANAVSPGSTDTPMLWSNPNVAAGVEQLEGAIGRPEDVAAAIMFLASAESRSITGTVLTVDNGQLTKL